MASGLPAGRYLAGRSRGLTLQPEPPEGAARGRDGVEGRGDGGFECGVPRTRRTKSEIRNPKSENRNTK